MSDTAAQGETCAARPSPVVFWLQGFTLLWMLAECGLSLLAAAVARSPAMLAFGSDSFVELLSAGIVLLQFLPGIAISERARPALLAFCCLHSP